MNPKKKKKKMNENELKQIWRPDSESPTDILGSYIGTQNHGEQPEQDADDL